MAQAPSSREDGGIDQEREQGPQGVIWSGTGRICVSVTDSRFLEAEKPEAKEDRWESLASGTRVTLRPGEIRGKEDPVMNETLGS